MTRPLLTRYSPDTVRPLLDRLVEIYVADVYAGDPVFSNETQFRQQLDHHMAAPRWELVTATIGNGIVGYIYGLTLSKDTDWWEGLLTEMPDDFTQENGERTLAISELLVRAPWRRQGIATALHNELLTGRQEERATLLVQPTYDAAQAAYASWGWQKVAQLHPTWPQAPIYDVMTLPLPARR